MVVDTKSQAKQWVQSNLITLVSCFVAIAGTAMVYKWRVDQLEARVTEQERRLQTIQRLETEFDHVGKSLEKMEKTLSDLNGSVIDRLARLEERVKNQ